MENYVKSVLYAYPLLKTVSEDYETHIRNKALLSYDSRLSAEALMEYIAGEILTMNRLEWLKRTVEGVLDKLSDTERTLVAIRYFGKKKRIRDFLKSKTKDGTSKKTSLWSERKYFRYQQRLGDRIGAMFRAAGLTEFLYLHDFAYLDIFKKIHSFIENGRDRKISADERRLLKF